MLAVLATGPDVSMAELVAPAPKATGAESAAPPVLKKAAPKAPETKAMPPLKKTRVEKR